MYRKWWQGESGGLSDEAFIFCIFGGLGLLFLIGLEMVLGFHAYMASLNS